MRRIIRWSGPPRRSRLGKVSAVVVGMPDAIQGAMASSAWQMAFPRPRPEQPDRRERR